MDPIENIETTRVRIRATADDLLLHARVRRVLVELDFADDAVLRALGAARQCIIDAAQLYADQCDDLGREELALGDAAATLRAVSGEVYSGRAHQTLIRPLSDY